MHGRTTADGSIYKSAIYIHVGKIHMINLASTHIWNGVPHNSYLLVSLALNQNVRLHPLKCVQYDILLGGAFGRMFWRVCALVDKTTMSRLMYVNRCIELSYWREFGFTDKHVSIYTNKI